VSAFCEEKDLGEPHAVSRSLRHNNRALGSLPFSNCTNADFSLLIHRLKNKTRPFVEIRERRLILLLEFSCNAEDKDFQRKNRSDSRNGNRGRIFGSWVAQRFQRCDKVGKAERLEPLR
jgi:hypothetical protein